MAYLYESRLEATDCYLCGTPFAFVAMEQRRKDGKPFFCPNGHSQVFGDTLADKLAIEREFRREAEEEKERLVRQLKRAKSKKR